MNIREFVRAASQVTATQKNTINILINIICFPVPYIWLFFEALNLRHKETSKIFFLSVAIFFIVFKIGLYFLHCTPMDLRYLLPFWSISVLRIAYFLEIWFKQHFYLEKFWQHFRLGLLVVLAVVVFSVSLWVSDYRHRLHVQPFIDAIRFLETKTDGRPLRIFTDTDHGFRWFKDWVVFDPIKFGFSSDFNKWAQDKKDYDILWDKYRIEYIVNSPWKSPWEKNLYKDIASDLPHYQKIYINQKTGLTIYKIVR
jgi:hypothetical protein